MQRKPSREEIDWNKTRMVEYIMGRATLKDGRAVQFSGIPELTDYVLRVDDQERLRAVLKRMLEMVDLIAPRERIIALCLEKAKADYPKLTEEEILSVIEDVIPHYAPSGE